MKVVLAEKPSVARDIAKELKATSRKDGYLEGNGWAVTWAFGHMVELKDPGEYDAAWKRWTLESLPMVPEKFQVKARSEKDAKKQLHVIRDLFKEAESIVCATDAGREGELIFRYIQEWAQVKRKPFERLWISSLTPQAIRKGFANLADGAAYDNLALAAKCRSEADWIVGLNATRFFTVQYGARGMLWSLGRVQTPVLAMIVKRDLEIENFKPEDYWEVHTTYREATFKHRTGRFFKNEDADAILAKIKDHDLVISELSEKQEKTPPPLLFDLTSLQKEMNSRYGFTADQTLKLAQALYEKKHLTYPRTDSRYLSADLKPEIPKLLERLKQVKEKEISVLDLAKLNFSKRIINDAKVTDHHAIIPTEMLPGSLSDVEQKVYDAVLVRLIAAFYGPCIKNATTVDAEVEQEPFRASGKVLVDAGWQVLYPKKPKKNSEEEDQELPAFEKGEAGPHEPALVTKKTSAPKRFNEASLLQMMETAGKSVSEEALREALKDKGIGTPATRASIIETLIQRKYIEREKKNLLSTAGGRHLIALIQDEQLKSPEMTGEWESHLKAMEAGKYDAGQFMNDVVAHTRLILSQAGASKELGPCPKCGKAIIRGRNTYGCSGWQEGCDFVIDQESLGINLEPGQVSELLFCGKSMKPVMLDGAEGKRFATIIREGESLRLENHEMESSSSKGNLGVCPVCGGEIIDAPKSWSCSNWRNGCPFTLWKTMAGKKIPKSALTALLKDGVTEKIDGFKSRAGKKFAAKLKIVGDEIKFEFDN